MRILNIKYTFILALVAFTSCSKFLDQDPVSSGTDETTWKTDDDANSAVAGCYSLTRSALNASVSFFAYGDLPTDYFNNSLDFDFLNIHNINWAISVPASNNYDPKLKLRVYTPFYAAIQQSNRCLHFLNEMPANSFTGDGNVEKVSRKNKYIGEAYFMRAFNYFYMARVWGDVPLDTSYQSDISTFTGIKRTPQKNILATCIEDLNKAKRLLDWKDPGSIDRAVRGDKGAVFALMAHVYAWRGDYDSCRMACDSVIQSGSYSLVSGSNYPSIYLGQSDESIFEIAQNTQAESMNATAYSASIANYTLAAPYIPTITLPNWQIDETYLKDLYSDSKDYRFNSEFTFINTGSQNYYFTTKYSNLQTITTSNSGNFYLLKNNLIIFRLADILLLKAEALAAKANPDIAGSLALVNQVRARANADPIVDVVERNAMIDTVTAERGRELFLEGHRYYDLVRNERLNGVARIPQITHDQFLAGKYYWPLDPSLFTLNPLLTQTPFWAQLLTN